jgi:hypothetical protein
LNDVKLVSSKRIILSDLSVDRKRLLIGRDC